MQYYSGTKSCSLSPVLNLIIVFWFSLSWKINKKKIASSWEKCPIELQRVELCEKSGQISSLSPLETAWKLQSNFNAPREDSREWVPKSFPVVFSLRQWVRRMWIDMFTFHIWLWYYWVWCVLETAAVTCMQTTKINNINCKIFHLREHWWDCERGMTPRTLWLKRRQLQWLVKNLLLTAALKIFE